MNKNKKICITTVIICVTLITIAIFVNRITFEQRTINAIQNRRQREHDALSRAIQDRFVKEGYMLDID